MINDKIVLADLDEALTLTRLPVTKGFSDFLRNSKMGMNSDIALAVEVIR